MSETGACGRNLKEPLTTEITEVHRGFLRVLRALCGEFFCCERRARSLWYTAAIPYSYRNATIGSTRVARRAGMKQAASATAKSSTATAINVTGSAGRTP
jgi:hypothetical protein